MEEFKPNSHKYREEQKQLPAERPKVEKVVTGSVKVKKNEMRKFKDVFIHEDMHNVGSYVLMDVLIPAIKDAIEDIVTNGIRMILRGETGSRKSGSSASKVSYSRFYDDRRDGRNTETRARTSYSYDDITFESRGEAELVLERMSELIDTYGMASVADLFDLAGETCSYTDNKYGWTNIRNAKVYRTRDGYLIEFPKAMPIN